MLGRKTRQSEGAGRAAQLRRKAIGAAALAVAATMATGASAQNCSPISVAIPGLQAIPNLNPGYATGLAASTAVSAVINSTNTAFLTQSSAFVGGPSSNDPNQEAGGIWVRSVGGNLTTKNQAGVNAGAFFGPATSASGGVCSSSFYQTYAGYQLGFDIGRFNWSDFNITVGVTAGQIGSDGQLNGGNLSGGAFNTSTQAPFVGAYAAGTYGNFFADALIRWNYYSTVLNSPTINLYNQKLDARGMTFAVAGGYRWSVPNTNWFLEPSLGMIWTYGKIEQLDMSNPVTGVQGFSPGNFQGSTEFSAFNSAIGRLGLRAGTSVEYGDLRLQPFAAASVWHEFGPNLTATYRSCPGCLFGPGLGEGVIAASISNQTIGTFGQYSVGTSAQLASMPGWLAFVRVDYRNGNRMEGISGTGGVRYQIASLGSEGVLVTKGPAPRVTPAHDWTGFYLGGFGGGAYGNTQTSYPGSVIYSQPQLAGISFGGTGGYNHQFGQYVFGAEADGGWLNAQGSAPCGPLAAGAPLFQMNCSGRVDWFATLAGRAGYASGQFLYFAKFGAAFIENQFSATCNLGVQNGSANTAGNQNCTNPAGLFSNGYTARDTRVGWTAGLGAEFALTQNWSAKGEIDYMEFGSRTNSASNLATTINGNTGYAMAKIGVNYNFGRY